ncbi:hypothetical protein Acj9p152 [Acinetobacter phage Acj9]|uniref:Uncharacterized protein n=1 Tax=Acinetobacter phage Acj9 TaxID=760939 RepID=E5EPT6_9CAUD|nr:hypothetical protein Acj9p152 [Acinetobacter phage Acj9]ADG60052.1 hypothetical protein Acj9p152 [Acinetobacter phage Acj9]
MELLVKFLKHLSKMGAGISAAIVLITVVFGIFMTNAEIKTMGILAIQILIVSCVIWTVYYGLEKLRIKHAQI